MTPEQGWLHVTVLCHQSTNGLIIEREKRRVYGAETIATWLPSPGIVKRLAEVMDRAARWTLVRTGEDPVVNVAEESFTGSLIQATLAALWRPRGRLPGKGLPYRRTTQKSFDKPDAPH